MTTTTTTTPTERRELERQLAWKTRFPLHGAACERTGEELRALLSSKSGTLAGIDALDEEGRTPAHYAAWNGLVEPLRVLLEHGANVHVVTPDRGSTPLHFAAGMGHLACVELLLAHGANTGARDCEKWTPRDLALQNLFNKPQEEIDALVTMLT